MPESACSVASTAVTLASAAINANNPTMGHLPISESAAERLAEVVDRRKQQHDEHRREDEEDERKEDLDRRLLRTLLRPLPAPNAHVVAEVAHDRPDRDTERLTLEDRANERAHRRRLAASQH